MYHEQTCKVGARDTDPFNQCRPSSVLDFLQEAATNAAVQLHMSREETVSRYHVFWMLARMWYRLDRPLVWNDDVTIRTWHRESRGAAMYRDFDLFQNGTPVGEAVSVWVLADIETRKLSRISDIPEFAGSSGGELCKDILLPKLKIPVPLESAGERLLRYSDTDINGHVNNVRYADFACDALHMERLGAGEFVSSLQIGYLKECRAGEMLRLSAGYGGGDWYVRGAGEEDTPRFEARLTLSPLDKPELEA